VAAPCLTQSAQVDPEGHAMYSKGDARQPV
jgi:hypothetical protein